MTIPYWVTPANLPTVNSVTTDLNQTPIMIDYHSDSTATITLLNGVFPAGLIWTRSGNSIQISGTPEIGSYAWTWRITNSTAISDRTYYLNIIEEQELEITWTGQITIVGYASAAGPTTYQVTANTNSNKSISYYLIPPLDNTGIPAGMTIDTLTGVINFFPENNIDVVTDIHFTVRAQIDSTYRDQLLTIIQVPIVFEPIWQTPGNTILGTIKSGEFFEYQMQVFNPNIDIITFTPASALPTNTLMLTSTGLLHGRVPKVTQITDYTVGITARNSIAEVTQYIKFRVLPNIDAALLFNSNATDLGIFEQGQLVVFDVSATSTRTRNLTYSIIGGNIPPGLRLDTFNGVIVGFLEFQPVDHTYAWEISVSDETATISQRYTLQVLSKGILRLDVTIPLMGKIKEQWITTKELLVDTFVVEPFSQFLPIDSSHPRLNLISGLNPVWINPDQFERYMQQQLKPIDLSFGNVSNLTIGTNQQLYVSIRDPQLQSNATAEFQTGTMDVASLTNIRNNIENYYDFKASINGTTASLVSTVDPSGQLSTVSVISPGKNYLFAPNLIVTGSGTGAEITSNLSIQSTTIVSMNGNWLPGDQVIVDIGEFDIPAIVVFDSTNNILNFIIDQEGNYKKFPSGPQTVYNSSDGQATVEFALGLSNIGILNAGTGYSSNTQITIDSEEILDPGLTAWQPVIPLAVVENSSMSRILANEQTNALAGLEGYQFTVDYVLLNYQGKLWTGSSRFDQNLTIFDGSSTTFDDYLEPSNTLFDQNKTTWDNNQTKFDYKHLPIMQYTANATVFETTLANFTLEPTQISSSTLIRKLVK